MPHEIRNCHYWGLPRICVLLSFSMVACVRKEVPSRLHAQSGSLDLRKAQLPPRFHEAALAFAAKCPAGVPSDRSGGAARYKALQIAAEPGGGRIVEIE